MQLSELSIKPELIEITLDDEKLVKKYGEPITFYTYDRQPLDIFMKMANAKPDNPSSMIDAMRPMILNKDGQPVIVGENIVPSDILVKAITKLVERLGNLSGQM